MTKARIDASRNAIRKPKPGTVEAELLSLVAAVAAGVAGFLNGCVGVDAAIGAGVGALVAGVGALVTGLLVIPEPAMPEGVKAAACPFPLVEVIADPSGLVLVVCTGPPGACAKLRRRDSAVMSKFAAERSPMPS